MARLLKAFCVASLKAGARRTEAAHFSRRICTDESPYSCTGLSCRFFACRVFGLLLEPGWAGRLRVETCRGGVWEGVSGQRYQGIARYAGVQGRVGFVRGFQIKEAV